jgi:4,5-DOPA dioxygenase extradiol
VDWRYLAVSILAGLLTFYRHAQVQRMGNSMQLFDAVGLGLFAVVGASKALAAGVGPVGSVMLGILSGVGGGIARDLLVAQVPSVLRHELYAVAALVGALVVVVGHAFALPPAPLAVAGAAFVLRLALAGDPPRLAAARVGRWRPGLGPAGQHGERGETRMKSQRMPVIFAAHGAPILLDDATWMAELASWSRAMPKPKSILMVSAHWEERPTTLGATRTVPLVYDFHGFPERYYQTRYEAPGAPDLAARVRAVLHQNDMPVADDPMRGLDHGAYVPLVAMYPDADVPVLQVSMPGLDAERLLQLGRALAPLREEGVLVFGSGFLTHNMAFAFKRGTPAWAGSSMPGRKRRCHVSTSMRWSVSNHAHRVSRWRCRRGSTTRRSSSRLVPSRMRSLRPTFRSPAGGWMERSRKGRFNSASNKP